MNKNYKNKNIHSVTTMTPHRISFAGGGTDYPNFFKKYEGEVLSSTINQYLFVTVKRHSEIYPEKFRLQYSVTEFCNSISEIKNNIARECIRLVPVDGSITISTASDLPPGSGTGSSSCFAVGLLNALHRFRGERVTASQIAREACKVEINILKKVSGKQDQYAASFGGFNRYIFKNDDKVLIESVDINTKNIERLFNNLKLIWTGENRDASSIASSYNFKDKKTISILLETKRNVEFVKDIIEHNSLNLKDLSNHFKNAWKQKKIISKKITSSKINSFSKKLLSLGIDGHRLIGAGGGGFFLCIASQKQIDILRKKYPKSKIIKISFEPLGSRILSVLYT
jgi:D-glycero-alpha-D-manno-heptose-7-phosphate kinase